MTYSTKACLFVACMISFLTLNSEECNNSTNAYSFIISSPKWIHEGADSIIEVSSTLVNSSKDTLQYQSEAGGWNEYYLVDNPKLEIYFPRDEFTGDKFFVTLPPGKTRMVYLPLRLKSNAHKFHGKFKIGMILKDAHLKHESIPKQTVLWSNSIEI